MPRLNVPEADAVLDRYFPVLDHGFVALADYMGGDLAVERFARASYEIDPEVRSIEKTRILLRYLLRHRHTSPFESTELSFHIGMPIFVARQWIRHRTASINEISARYTELPEVFYHPEAREVCFQSEDNKQGSGEAVDAETFLAFDKFHRHAVSRSLIAYKGHLANGVAREMARIDLTLSTYTYFNWKIDLHNLFHLAGLRSKPDAQAQARPYSDAVIGLAKFVAPICVEAFEDYHFNSVTFSRMEMDVLLDLLERDRSICDDDVRDLLASEGVSNKREQGEFLDKLRRKPARSFEVDMTSARDASYFTDKAHAATA